MPTTLNHQVTSLLQSASGGDPQAAEELLPLVYEDLRRLAAVKMRGEPAGHTLQATALVHEAWLRVAGEQHNWQSRRHFFTTAAEAMRRILIDRARRRQRQKHGSGQELINLDDIDIAVETDDTRLLQVSEALESLTDEDPIKAELVKLRFFVGLRIPEAAEILGISGTTAKRHWNYARAFLYDALKRQT
jgi:RNA polymerase sigma factor (TIGR02999 family)